MRPSERNLWRAVQSVVETDTPDFEVETDVCVITDPEDVEPDPPEGATVLETESDVVTVWATD